MHKGKVILLGMARPGFDIELAQRVFNDSGASVEKLGYSVTRSDSLVTDAEDAGRLAAGTSVDIRLEKPVQEALDTVIYGGFEHHFSLVWKDITAELVELCSLMDIPFVTL